MDSQPEDFDFFPENQFYFDLEQLARLRKEEEEQLARLHKEEEKAFEKSLLLHTLSLLLENTEIEY